MHWKLYAGGSLHVLKHGRPRQKEVPGGWACVIKDHEEQWGKELNGAEVTPTILRMKLLAVVSGLEEISKVFPGDRNNVQIFSDSEYVFEALVQSMPEENRTSFYKSSEMAYHQLHGSRGHRHNRVGNDDLCERLQNILRWTTVTFTKVLQSSSPKEHQRCHVLATRVRRELAGALGYL